MGDAGIGSAEPLLAMFERLGLPGFFETFNLESGEKDELEPAGDRGGGVLTPPRLSVSARVCPTEHQPLGAATKRQRGVL